MKTKITSILFLFLINTLFFASNTITDTIELHNKNLTVKISLQGAEIISMFNKKENIEHIWQAKKESWNHHAPILFPIVGKLKGGKYQIDDKEYKMKIHGFASKQEFSVKSQTKTSLVLEIRENSETLKIYPFKFRLQVSYILKGNRLSITNSVENTDTKEIFFSIGAHPGFNVPFKVNEEYNDYYLEFS